MYRLNKKVAMICGVNASIIARFIKDKIDSEEALIFDDKKWCRCSILMMTGYFPFLTRHMIADAINRLVDFNIIKKNCHNLNRFDHTNWYTFTDYGNLLLTKENNGRNDFKCDDSCVYYDEENKSCGVCVKNILDEVKEKHKL